MWRYRELLPVADGPTVGLEVGFTPLIKADRLAKRLGIRELWIKNDTVNYPTLSFKDRVVSVALSRARELGFDTVACASTGNLANSVAANAASAGLKAYRLHPVRPGAGQDRQLPHLRREGHRHQRPLRRGEPALRGNRRQVRLGIRQRQHAALLRRRLEEHGVRDCRATWLACAAAHHRADGVGFAC